MAAISLKTSAGWSTGIFNDYIRRQGTVNASRQVLQRHHHHLQRPLAVGWRRAGPDRDTTISASCATTTATISRSSATHRCAVCGNPYPGYPLSLGDRGEYVVVIQQSLNRISRDYPSIPKVNPVDSIFGQQTGELSAEIQQIFDLAETVSWASPPGTKWCICTPHHAPIGLEARTAVVRHQSIFPRIRSAKGRATTKVSVLQCALSTIALFNSAVLPLSIDGIFGKKSRGSRSSPSRKRICRRPAWWTTRRGSRLRGVARHREYGVLGNRPRPLSSKRTRVALQLGDERAERARSANLFKQHCRRGSRMCCPCRGRRLRPADAPVCAVLSSPRGASPTGIVDRTTWDAITNSYQYILEQTNTMPRQYPGQPPAGGSRMECNTQSAGTDMTSA